MCQRKQKNFQLDPDKFYREWNNGKLHDQNIEMMIEETSPFSIDDMLKKAVHIHQGNDNKQYVCYPPEVKTMNQAVKIAVSWSIVTILHMKYQADASLFENFANWILKKTATGKCGTIFDELPLWIIETFKWKVEFKVTTETEEITTRCRQEILEILEMWYRLEVIFYHTDWVSFS